MEKTGSPWEEMGADFFVRALQDFARSSERKLAELSFEKSQLEARVLELETLLSSKDRIIKEYLRRVALLEFSIKREKGSVLPEFHLEEDSEPPAAPSAKAEALGCREILRRYLIQMDALGIQRDFIPEAEHEVFASKQDIESIKKSVRDSPKERWQIATVLKPSLVRSGIVHLSQNGKELFTLVGSDDGLVRVWTEDPSKLKDPVDSKSIVLSENTVNPRAVLRGHCAELTSATSSGRTLFTGDAQGDVFSWSLSDELSQMELFPGTENLKKIVGKRFVGKLHSGAIASVSVHTSLPLLATSGSRDRFLAISRIHSASFTTEHLMPLPDTPIVSFWDPLERNRLITATECGSLHNHDAAIGTEVNRAKCPDGLAKLVSAVQIDAINAIAVCFSDGTCKLVDRNTFTFISQFTEKSIAVMAASGNRLAVGSTDGTIQLRDLRNLGEPLWKQDSRGESVCALAFANQGNWLAAAAEDGKVLIYQQAASIL